MYDVWVYRCVDASIHKCIETCRYLGLDRNIHTDIPLASNSPKSLIIGSLGPKALTFESFEGKG